MRSNNNKRESWEKIRQRPSKFYANDFTSKAARNNEDCVWIRRESVHTQTGPEEIRPIDSSSDHEDSSSLPRARTASPNGKPRLGLHYLSLKKF